MKLRDRQLARADRANARFHQPAAYGSLLLALLCAGPALASGGEATAQGTTGKSDPDTADLAPVTVTASRVDRSGFNAPTPTTVVGADRLEREAVTNVDQVLNEIPSFKADTTPATNGVRAATPGSSYADLRGLGATRTLVMVDGQRYVPQIVTVLNTYQVDINQIPSILVDHVDVVTGGASAQWGSDAVAGVVNVITKKNFEGLQAEVQGGESRYSDDQERRIGILGGVALFDHRLHLEAAFDYDHNNGVGDSYTRPWGQQAWQILTNTCSNHAAKQAPAASCPGGYNNQAQQLILPNVEYSTLTNGGLILNTALAGTQFGPGGSPTPFQYGAYAGTTFMQGGDPANMGYNINTGVTLEDWVDRKLAYARAAFDITDSTQAYVDVTSNATRGGGQTLPPRDTGPLVTTIYSGNPFIPASTQSAMSADDIGSFQLGRNDVDIGNQQSDQVNTTTRVVAGLNGSLGGSWAWDAAYNYGYNRYSMYVTGDRITQNYTWATNAIWNSAHTQIVCAATVSGSAAYNPKAAGCVPINLFGEGSPSQAAINYVTGAVFQRTNYRQQDANANLHGEPFNTWAGPVSVAIGFEYRDESEMSEQDPISLAQGFESSNSQPIDGSFNTKEGYLETVVPFAKDLPWAQSLDLDAAVRAAGYSTSAGEQTTWKVGLTWRPVEDLLLRLGRSRDIRAPNIYELDSPALANNTNVAFGTYYQGGVYSVQSGNPNLKPEVGSTLTAGFTWQPHFVPGLGVSLDYYRIDVTNAIGALAAATVANYCALGNAASAYYCSMITTQSGATWTPGAIPYSVATPYLNLGESIRQGFEFNVNYKARLDDLVHGLPGAVSLGLSGNYFMHYQDNAGTGLVERAGDIVGSPKLVSGITVGYDIGKLSLSSFVRYIGAANYDNTLIEGININDNHVPSYVAVNFSANYAVTDAFQVFGVVRNAFDRAPPMEPTAFGYPTNATYYDTIGQTFRVGFRYKF